MPSDLRLGRAVAGGSAHCPFAEQPDTMNKSVSEAVTTAAFMVSVPSMCLRRIAHRPGSPERTHMPQMVRCQAGTIGRV